MGNVLAGLNFFCWMAPSENRLKGESFYSKNISNKVQCYSAINSKNILEEIFQIR
jgi:hypothetical protein